MTFALSANALITDDKVGVCYEFKNNKVVEKNICLISYASAQDDTYIDLKVNNKIYKLFSHYSSNSYTLDGQLADFYYRTPTHFNKYRGSWKKRHLACYKSILEEVCYLDTPLEY